MKIIVEVRECGIEVSGVVKGTEVEVRDYVTPKDIDPEYKNDGEIDEDGNEYYVETFDHLSGEDY